MIYAESSVLAALVMHDSNTGNALELVAGLDRPLFFNRLLKLEVCNAIRLNVAAGKIDEVTAAKSERSIENLLRSGEWVEVEPVWERVFQRALGFSKAHTSLKRTRSFDILHVAVAVELNASEFWSFDKWQRSLATEVGFRVNP
jgi:predicted nucleic acid-binding protein